MSLNKLYKNKIMDTLATTKNYYTNTLTVSAPAYHSLFSSRKKNVIIRARTNI